MLKIIKQLWKQYHCDHDYQWVRNIYGDEIIYKDFNRSIWKCKKCGKIIYREKLYLENEK